MRVGDNSSQPGGPTLSGGRQAVAVQSFVEVSGVGQLVSRGPLVSLQCDNSFDFTPSVAS